MAIALDPSAHPLRPQRLTPLLCARDFEQLCSSVERAWLRQSADVSTSRDFWLTLAKPSLSYAARVLYIAASADIVTEAESARERLEAHVREQQWSLSWHNA